MNTIHASDSNKFTQQKRVLATILLQVYWNCAILFLMSPGINLLYYCVLIHIAGSSRKLVKIGGSSEPLEPPLVTGLNCIMLLQAFLVFFSIIFTVIK